MLWREQTDKFYAGLAYEQIEDVVSFPIYGGGVGQHGEFFAFELLIAVALKYIQAGEHVALAQRAGFDVNQGFFTFSGGLNLGCSRPGRDYRKTCGKQNCGGNS